MAKSDKAYKFTFYKKALYYETWTVEADSETEAKEILEGGGGYMDWKDLEYYEDYDYDYTLEDTEIIDPLLKMIADKNAEILESKMQELKENG